MRTHLSAQLGVADIGRTVAVADWLHNRRDHGGVIFIGAHLSDRHCRCAHI